MITFLNGTIVDKQPTRLVLDVAGVGYEIFIPLSTYDRLPGPDAACRVLTHDYVREDSHLLFGFATEEERAVFELLMGTSGIGPKIALSALSGLSVRDIKAAIVEGDVKRLSSISGIGKRTAERLVVELRDKFSAGEALEALAGAEAPSPDEQRLRDAVLALVALGYQRQAAYRMATEVLKKAAPDESLDVEALIKRALGGGK